MKLPAWAFGVGAGDDTPISLTVRPGLHLDGPAINPTAEGRAEQMTDEEHIRELIQRWAAAVHTGDMATVLAGS